MTPAQQKTLATKQKAKTENKFNALLIPYIQEIVRNYRIGQTNISQDAEVLLQTALRAGYIYGTKQVIGVDIREYKQNDKLTGKIYKDISQQLDNGVSVRVQQQIPYISKTSDKWISSVSKIAIEEKLTQKEADALLAARLNNQKLTIAVTESQWTIETVRKAAVISISDPLNDSVEEMARLLSIRDYTGAKKIMKQIDKLKNIAISKNQGELIRLISSKQETLINPLSQARVLANVREKASELGKEKKIWQIFGYKTRQTHIDADGQEVGIDEPFVLAGGLLQYPGDGSLGASLSEIINCNCVASYT